MAKRAWLATGVLLITLWPGTGRADYEEGVEAYRRGEYSAAYREFLSAAEQGDGNAAHALGFMCLTGKGVAQDNAQAIQWYRKAAELGVGIAPPPSPSRGVSGRTLPGG